MSGDVFIKSTKEIFDAIVVGSGITGGWAAKELTERGLRVLMVERGRAVEHRKDYVGEAVPPWKLPHRGRVDAKTVESQHAVQSTCYAFNDATRHFFGNDRDLPYATAQGRPFSWIRGNQLGGKSLIWHRQSYRLSDLDFEANLRDGHGVDWPIRYNDLKPWYDHVERHAGISGAMDGIDVLPDGVFQPPFEMNTVEKRLKEKIEAAYPDIRMIIGRCAHLTQPTPEQIAIGRTVCMARNECQKGCSFGAYFSTQSSTLPMALATGRLAIATDAIVHSVIYDPHTNRATGVRVIDAETLESREYVAKVVFLCASTLGTTQILLNSSSEHFPTGLGNSSDTLGRYLMDHLYGAGARGRVEGFRDEYYSGRRPTWPYIPRFRNVRERHAKFIRGYSLGGSGYRDGWRSFGVREGFGIDFKRRIREAGDWRFSLSGSGEMLPRADNTVRLHPTLKDKWGMPQLLIDCSFGENDLAMYRDMAETSAEILDRIGVKDIEIERVETSEDHPPGLAIHEMGTARMGRDPKTSVLNRYNQCHDVPNVFVTDGACMTSSAWQNPSLTYMALTARACHHAVEQLKRGDL
ncbi:MAG: GMC family oxidoreductase [Rhodanobacteraceae bacterium]|nr:GMC family oxidoreductase [Rhodanobacteraceae bacterium]